MNFLITKILQCTVFVVHIQVCKELTCGLCDLQHVCVFSGWFTEWGYVCTLMYVHVGVVYIFLCIRPM